MFKMCKGSYSVLSLIFKKSLVKPRLSTDKHFNCYLCIKLILCLDMEVDSKE